MEPLAIAPHQVDTKAWIFSSGWWNDPKGDADQAALVVGSGQVAPDKLTSATAWLSTNSRNLLTHRPQELHLTHQEVWLRGQLVTQLSLE
jgi:hypothetical protein